MIYEGLPKRVLEKHRLELLALHKRCCKTYLVQRDITYKTRKKFFKLYDMEVCDKNIEIYFNIPINLFVQALVKYTLHLFFRYTNKDDYVRKNRRKSIHRKSKD